MTASGLEGFQKVSGAVRARGIYSITCEINGMVYVGRAVDIMQRFRGHLRGLLCGEHHNRALQRDFLTFGQAAFSFSIHEIHTDPEAEKAAEGELIERYAKEGKAYNTQISGKLLPREIQARPTVTGIDAVVHRIRVFRRVNGIARARLAEMAAIWENALRGMDDESWNPTVNTLRKLDALVPADFAVPERAAA